MLAIRFFIGGSALLQGLLAVWLLTAEVVRPSIPYFPSDPAVVDTLADLRAPARFAATWAFFRGDLWADYTMTLAAGGLDDSEAGSSTINEARRAARRAARLSPHDARVWLVLALIASRMDQFEGDNAEAESLKMSFYTGPSETVLMPLRLRLTTESNLIENEELRDLAAHDIRALATRRPELKPAIGAAYRTASPQGRHFIEATIGDLDSSMLRTLIPEAR